MADEAETLDIVVDETAPDPLIETTVDDKTKKVVEPDEGIETLKAQLAAEKERGDQAEAARRAAEAEASRHAQEAAKAKTEKQDGELQLVENAIGSIKAEQDILTDKYADALAAQDYVEAAKIQRKLSGNEAKLLTLENGLESLKTAPKPQPREVAADPVETLAGQLTPKSASWVRSHPEYARDQRLYQRMIAAHNLAVTDGLEPESDGYFAAIEQTLGIGRQAADETGDSALSAAAQPAQRRSAPPAAPVGRGGGASPSRVTLTAQEVEMAEMMGMTREEYARNKVALQKEGRLH